MGKIGKILVFICAVSLAAGGCGRNNLVPERSYENTESAAIKRTVMAGVSDCGYIKADLTKETLTKTAIEYHEPTDAVADTHRVIWTPGDRVYSYSESGVYMFDQLKADPEKSIQTDPHYTKVEIIYREGDKWYNAYFKGKAIGDYIGRRTQYKITFKKGIPYAQNGKFADTHIGIATEYPLTLNDIEFTNMQSFLRFRTEGDEKDNVGDTHGNGKIGGKKIHKITLRNMVNEVEGRSDAEKEMMAGNLEMDIEVENAWKYSLLRRTGEADELADTMVTVIPEGDGYFKWNEEYFAAVPVRTYLKGIYMEFYDDVGAKLAYVKTPKVTVNYNQIYDCTDILKYVVFSCTKLSFRYDDDKEGRSDPEITSVTMKKGHKGTFVPIFEPEVTTDKTLTWTWSPEGIVEVGQDGTVTAVGVGECDVTATTTSEDVISGGFVKAVCHITVKESAGVGAGSYTTDTYGGSF